METKKPTTKQIHIWDNDGGHPTNSKECFAVINGMVCYSTPQKWWAYLTKYGRLVRMKFHSSSMHRQQA